MLLDDLWGYQLNFTGDIVYVAAIDEMMFYVKDSGIIPGTKQDVGIVAVYKTLAQSPQMHTQSKMPDACK